MGWTQSYHNWAQDWAFRIILRVLLWKQDLKGVLPLLEAAPQISTSSFVDTDRLNLHECGSYKIVNCLQHLSDIKDLQLDETLATSESKRKRMEAVFDRLLATVIPHISEKVKLEDCYYYGCIVQKDGYLPVIHTDTDWLMFPGHDGFQLWYLLENDEEQNQGNMFLAKTKELSPSDPPVHFEFEKGGTVVKKKADQKKYPVLGKWPCGEVETSGLLSFDYLDMQPGDCLIMGKQTLHMSDPRPHLRGVPFKRRALAMRIIVCKPGQDFHFNVDHLYTGYMNLHKSLKERALELNDNLGESVWKLKLDSRVDMHDARVALFSSTKEADGLRVSNLTTAAFVVALGVAFAIHFSGHPQVFNELGGED